MIAAAVSWSGGDPRWSGLTDADAAAVEIALRLAGGTDDEVAVVTVGPPEAEPVLRQALAAGCARAVRVEAPAGLASVDVARALAAVEVVATARWIVCGNASAVRGSGSVPASLAAELGISQGLGLVTVSPGDRDSDTDTITATRRLDGGRREELELAAPAVISVEGAVARLRRPSIGAELAARHHPVEPAPPSAGAGAGAGTEPVGTVRPYRPRARVLAGPEGATLERVRRLLAAGSPVTTAETVTLEPAAAAERIVATLRRWGYLADEPCEG